MRAHHHHFHTNFIIKFVFCCLVTSTFGAVRIQDSAGGAESHRRILHQPLYPASTAPPPVLVSPPPPPETSDQPFFPEVPTYSGSNQTPPPPPAVQTNGSVPIPSAAQAQPAKPTKKVAIAISVGIVTLGMLSALAFFLFRHRARHPNEAQKLVGGGDTSRRVPDESRAPPSTFLYIGTVEPGNRRSVPGANVENGANGSPYHKLNSIKRSDRYRPSPELQPLPPLAKALSRNSVSAMSSSDEESLETSFYTPYGSMGSTEDGYYTPVSRRSNPVNGHSSLKPTRGENNHNPNSSVPHSKRTSPRARLSVSPPEDTKLTMIPSIKQLSPSTLPPAESRINRVGNNQLAVQVPHQKPKFAAPPPPPNRALLQAISRKSPQRTNIPAPPPPPPPPPPLRLFTPRKLASSESKTSSTPSQLSTMELPSSSSPKTSSTMESPKPSDEVNRSGNSLERHDSDERAKLKPLHWDKVRATSDRATVWDQLKSSSFQLNEDMMETLFGCNSANSVQKEATRKSVLAPVERENRVLDPKKSQNIAILLRALNVTKDEVSDALLEGNPESLGAELLETLVKMAPTKEEEIKLRDYNGDTSKLGSAERFLKTVLDIPFAFKRVEAMLYRANFDAEVKYLKKSFHTLEEASEELKSSRLFLKLLEAVLRTGNRMNVGTNRGDARAFKLDTLLKLVDIKGTDGKTTLLHFVVQEIIRSEDADTESTIEKLQNKINSRLKDGEFNKRGLQVVAGLSRDLGSVKKAAGMDSDVLSGYVSKLESGLNKVKLILQHERPNLQGGFFNSMKLFLKEADEEIVGIKSDERKALSMVKEVTEYFHGDTAKEEAHPLRIFMIVRDFLFVLDHVCKEVGNMQDRAIVGAARSFRISSSASLPVLNRFNVRQESSDDESLSP